MKKFFLLILVIMILVSLMSGCKENPAEPIVGNKQEDIINNIQSDTASNPSKGTQNLSQDSVQKTIDTGNSEITVTIDAKVEKPDTDKYPVVRIETKDFTQEQVNKIINILFSDRTLYQPWDTTKAEIEPIIIQLKQIIQDPNSTEDERGMAKSRLQYEENKYQKAPDTVEKQPAITHFVTKNPQDQVDYADGQEYTIQGDPYDEINIWAEAGENSRSVLNAYNIDNGANSWMLYTGDVSRNFEGYLPYQTIIEGDQTNSGFKYTDAEKIAQDIIKNMGIDLYESSSSLVSYLINAKSLDDIQNAPLQAYKFFFTRNVNNVIVNYDTVISLGELNNDYNKAVYYEVVEITVDETGIRNFAYRAPYRVADIIEKDAQILGLDAAIVKFESHMKQIYAAALPEYPLHINIHTIKLGLSRIKNTDGSYLLIPTWDFMGNIIYNDKSSDPQNQLPINYVNPNLREESINPNFCITAVNAINGSIIDKAQGY